MAWFSFNPVRVELIYEKEQGDPTQPWGNGRKYFLLLRDGRGREKRILAADLTTTGGGMGLERWEINRQGRKRVFSAYFVINSLGHDLDQWAHYDLSSGQKLKGFKGAMELEEERQQALEEAQKRNQRPKIVVNARGDEKRVG
jgi:hypothetical protein